MQGGKITRGGKKTPDFDCSIICIQYCRNYNNSKDKIIIRGNQNLECRQFSTVM